MAQVIAQEKRAWTDSEGCASRVHCDWCPFVLERRETPLGDAHIWPRHRVGDRPGMLDEFTAPPADVCPFGVMFDTALAVRADRLVANVARGVTSAKQALKVATTLGVSLE